MIYDLMIRILYRGSLFKYDPTVSFWNFLVVGNYASKICHGDIITLHEVILLFYTK